MLPFLSFIVIYNMGFGDTALSSLQEMAVIHTPFTPAPLSAQKCDTSGDKGRLYKYLVIEIALIISSVGQEIKWASVADEEKLLHQ